MGKMEAMVATAIANLFPGLTTNEMIARIISDIRNFPGSSGGGGGGQPTGIHTWLERFGKLKPLSFNSAATPQEAEDWITYMEKLFEVLGCGEEFKARLATFKLEGDALNLWKAHKQAKRVNRIWLFVLGPSFIPLSISGTFQILSNRACDATRNIEIFHEGVGYKRNRDGDRVQPRGQNGDNKGQSGRIFEPRGQSDRGQSGRNYDQRRLDSRGQDSRSTGRQGNDRHGYNNNQRQWRDQSSRGS
ncbi:reverse transcriptase domain-containing protein [Artemisia annua]|uniref:Reverse transcriptase domain-containing protein n=1 Tax=Artemisia annua TaxID=35608 RepID=A0A2U1P4W3_ARTAN|nr:reverse transcriptase domain-containing protein [Artemisia annua]